MNCDRKDCKHGGKWAVKLNVPATGVPIDLHTPIGIVIGLVLCESCFADVKVADFLTPQMRDIVERAARMSVPEGRLPLAPDYARAWLSKVSASSEEYLRLKRKAEARS